MYTLNELDVDRNQRHERMLAEAADSRFHGSFAPAQTWQSRLCRQIGHGLVSAGQRLQSSGLHRRLSGVRAA